MKIRTQTEERVRNNPEIYYNSKLVCNKIRIVLDDGELYGGLGYGYSFGDIENTTRVHNEHEYDMFYYLENDKEVFLKTIEEYL